MNWTRFKWYQFRWQCGAAVMAPLLYIVSDTLGVPAWASMFICSLVGACIMYPADKYIFTSDRFS